MRIHSTRIASAGMAMNMKSLHVISLQFGGNGNGSKNLAWALVSLHIHIIVSHAYEHAMLCFLVAFLLACLCCLCLLVRLLLNNFLLLYSARRHVRGLPQINLFIKNAVATAQNCSETQILDFLPHDHFVKNVLSITQKCSETQILICREATILWKKVVSIV